MLTVGVVRIGNEPVIKFTPDNKAVLDLSLAYDYGRKDNSGKRPTQWINATLWGDRCEKLLPYLNKGKQLFVQLADVHVEAYLKKDGTAASTLKARVVDLQLIGDKSDSKSEPLTQSKTEPRENADEIPF